MAAETQVSPFHPPPNSSIVSKKAGFFPALKLEGAGATAVEIDDNEEEEE